jgi:general secretion pathway protein A
MYLDFFKFRKNPFHITPDPDFLFLSPSHNEAFSSISHGIEQHKGLVAVTGEVGVGKTTILRSYLEGTDPARIRIVYIFNAALSFGKLMKQIVSELGIPVVDKDIRDLIDSLFLYLIDEYKNGHRVVLIIDEAQNLPVETLVRFRMLSNRETSQEKLLQVILVGQPEFENKLNLPELRELKERIAIRCRIDALQPDESFAYIQHRLMKASSFHNPVFTKDALKRIVKESRGIPRIINVVCDNALITAFGYQRNPVDGKIIKEVIKDLRGGKPGVSFRWRYVLVPALVVFSGLVVLASMALLTPKEIPPVRTKIFSAKIPALPPAAEAVKEPGLDPSVEEASKAEPEPSIPGVPATGSDKSVSEIVPPAPVQREIPGEAQAPVAEKAPVPNDGGAPAKGGTAERPKLQSYRYMVQLGSYVDKETAEEIKARLEANGYRAVIKTHKLQEFGKVFVIQLQPVDSASRAAKLMTQLRGEFEGEPAIIKVPSR